MADDIAQIIDRLVTTWNSHDPEQVAALYTEDCFVLDIALPQPLIGREGVRLMFEGYYHAFPDLHLTQEDLVVEGDRLALFWTARATHRGAIMAIPATGRSIAVRGVNRLVLKDGKVCETLTIWDVAGMLRALNLLPNL
jgi:steroid delta-isomerase-like uncharacterized protein